MINVSWIKFRVTPPKNPQNMRILRIMKKKGITAQPNALLTSSMNIVFSEYFLYYFLGSL